MTDPMEGKRVLAVEDEPLFALRGPASRVEEALALCERACDVALLDVNLGGTPVFPVAAALRSRAVPFIFVTAYDPSTLPVPYRVVPVVRKPLDPTELTRTLQQVVMPS